MVCRSVPIPAYHQRRIVQAPVAAAQPSAENIFENLPTSQDLLKLAESSKAGEELQCQEELKQEVKVC